VPGRGNSRGEQAPLATSSQQVKDRVKDGAQVGRAWPPTRPGGRQVRGDPGPGGVVEIEVVASGAHGSRNRADEPCFARGGSTSQTPSNFVTKPEDAATASKSFLRICAPAAGVDDVLSTVVSLLPQVEILVLHDP
jgi:hypothetical protein